MHQSNLQRWLRVFCVKKDFLASQPSYYTNLAPVNFFYDRLCGLVVRVLDYRYRGPGFDSRALRGKKVVGLEGCQLSLVSTTEELLDRKVAAPVYKIENTAVGDPSRWPRGTLNPQKLAITSPTSGGRSFRIVRSRTQTMEFFLNFFYFLNKKFL
jgi:hypothetical protein